jgi:ligand-binding sensor domain-containing protein
MRLPTRKKLALGAAALLLLLMTAVAVGYWRVTRVLRGAEQTVEEETNLKFVVRPLVSVADTGFEWVSAPADIAQAAEYQGQLYVAGPSGLVEYDERGSVGRTFRVGRELPSSPLTRIARATLADSPRPELIIATAGAGILAFDGSSFRQILPEARDARAITAILPLPSGHLLIGTEKRGLLVYDGRRLSPFHSSLMHVHVTELAGSDADLWIGTQDQGAAHWHGGNIDWFGERTGLPDARVYAIAAEDERAYVGTPAGIALFERGRPARVLASGAFVRALLPRGNRVLAATMDDGIVEIPLDQPLRQVRQSLPATHDLGDLGEVEQFIPSGDSLYAVTPHGLFRRTGTGEWNRVLQSSAALLADHNISALAVDASGALWVGYFDHGLDLVEPGGQRARHVEDDQVFCINRILPQATQGVTAVATANGLVLFDRNGNRRQVLRHTDGLIADHVTDIARYGDGMVAATSAGLTFLDSGGVRSLYAFHGLVNNHVYALGAQGQRLLAGTLGGLTLLEKDQVRASYTTANSALKHNWITAVLPLDTGWWVGTYGQGIVHLDNLGHFERAEGAGDLLINFNAMLATDRLVLAGTQGQGLYVMQRGSGRWLPVLDGLPSLNVTALAAANGYVYVGTDNGLVRIPEQRLAR